MTLAPGSPIGKYVVRRKIAEGGMAEIYLAASQGPEGFEKDVAIKRIRSFLASEPGFVEMFIAEARLASRLNHANVVQIFDFDKHEDSFYLAMEFVRGHSLWDVRKRSKERMHPMPPVLVAHVGAEVARGLAYAHKLSDRGRPLNLVHRDVTPHNVLVSFDGAVKLTDFGVAKAGNSQTAAGVLKGKFAYMSPEQSRGEPVDARTDVFALGIVLWEMLTGGRLFDGDTDVAILRAVQERSIAPPARLNPDVPADIDAAVMRALERDLSKRWASAAEFERALAEAVLRNAKTLEDRDPGAYLRSLFPEELEEHVEGTRSGSGPVVASQASPVPREPTAVMGKGAPRATPAPPLSPDEDFHAATHVVDRKDAARSGGTAVRDTANDRAPAAPAPTPRTEAADVVASPPPPTLRGDAPAEAAKPGEEKGARRRFAAIAAGLVVISAVGLALWSRGGEPAAPPVEVAPPVPVVSAPASAEPQPSVPAEADAVQAPPVPTEQPPATAPDAQSEAARLESEAALAEAVAAKAEQAKPAPTKPALRDGTVTLTVIPYAAVYIDGKRAFRELSRTRKIKLPPGKHRVVLRHDLKGDRAFDFVLEPGGEQTISHNFLR